MLVINFDFLGEEGLKLTVKGTYYNKKYTFVGFATQRTEFSWNLFCGFQYAFSFKTVSKALDHDLDFV